MEIKEYKSKRYRCAQVAVSSGGVGSNPTSDKYIVFVQVIQC